MSDQLRQFKEYVSSSSLQYSYKLVLLRVILPLVDASGLSEIDTVVQSFRDYYLARQKGGLAIDRPGAAINQASSMTVASIKSLLLDNPFAAYSRAGWMRRVGERIGFAPDIWAQMTLADREELWRLADQRLENYYETRAGSHSLQSLNEILSTYDDTSNQPEPLLTARDAVVQVHQFITNSGFQYSYTDLANFYLSLRTKPFVILAGISGTGKSLLPKLFANAISGERRIIPVRPDWNDGSDLLGYLDLEGRFRPGELTGIVEECRANPDVPYLAVLDEMNLARVEHYLSDVLSIMETRCLDNDSIVTESLFKDSHFKVAEDRERYAGITLPENLYLVGTVNMDETTHPFSKKVLDRANTIEFSQVNLKGYIAAGGVPEQIVLRNDQLRGNLVHLADALAQDPAFVDSIVDKLVIINRILSQANLHVGYRVRDEVVIYMLHNRLLELLDESEAFDYQLLQKILPRIQGSSQPVRRVLIELLSYCGGANLGAANDDMLVRLQEYEAGDAKGLYARSAAKLATMLRRYEEDGFTSYWI